MKPVAPVMKVVELTDAQLPRPVSISKLHDIGPDGELGLVV